MACPYYKDKQPTRRAWILRPLRGEPTEDHATGVTGAMGAAIRVTGKEALDEHQI